MTDKGVDQKPSETAFFAALRRAIAHKDYGNDKFGPDNLAGIFLPPHFRFFLKFAKVRANTKEKLDGFLPGMTSYMIARTAYFDRHFVEALKNRVPQIVLLGAGYDTRAFRFAKLNAATKIFELDAAPTQNRKLKCLKSARLKISPQVKLVPINFNEESLKDVLAQAGYDPQQKTLFLWEGVSYYLEAEAVSATLEIVHQAQQPESAIVFDYTVPLSGDNLDELYGVEAFAKTMKEAHANEALLFSIAEADLGSFLEQSGLKVVEHFNNQEIEKAYLLDDSGTLLGNITGNFRFVTASKS